MSNRENADCRASPFDVAMLEAEFRKDKAKRKSNFTRSLNKQCFRESAFLAFLTQ